MANELALLQATRLKGRLSPDLACSSADIDLDTATSELDSLRASGLVKGASAVRLTPEGRTRLAELVATERAGVDSAALADLYEEFDDHNSKLKQIITDWQMRGGTPNDHSDSEYDRAVVDRLDELDAAFKPLVKRIADLAPRLQAYATRFRRAIDNVLAGDSSFMARPITDSYHTVWFEFHEELIGLLGLSREDEAAAGRAV